MHPTLSEPDPMQPAAAARTAPAAVPAVFVLALALYVCAQAWGDLALLSSFSIGNAVLLGLLARIPHWRTTTAYLSIAAASALAHALAATPALIALLWGIADACGVALGAWMLAKLPHATRYMQREHSPLFLLVVCLCATATTVAGHLPVWWQQAEPRLLASAMQEASIEFMNHILVVPMVLSFAWPLQWRFRTLADTLPLASLIVAELLASMVGGPGAIAFTLPCFIWCALRYRLFSTSVLFALFTVWKCHAFMALESNFATPYFDNMLSLRLGLSLLWLGPLTVACSHAARTEVLQRLHYASQHDHLTHSLLRATFMQRSNAALTQLHTQNGAAAVLMLDIDHFKNVNDEHGHAMGDTVLKGFAAAAQSALRTTDIMGRYGGEEFCACLPNVTWEEAQKIAERVRAAVMAQAFPTATQGLLQVTVSAGLAYYPAGHLPDSIDSALKAADALLYRAKHAGRNRVEAQQMNAPAAESTASKGAALDSAS